MSTTEPTLAECLKQVLEYAARDVVFFDPNEDKEPKKERPDAAYEHLRKVLELENDRQVELFSVILEEAMCGRFNASDLASKLGVPKIELLSWKKDLDYLASKRYILYNSSRLRFSPFMIPGIVVTAISENRKPTIEDLSGYSIPKFVKQLDSLFRSFYHDEVDFETVLNELEILYIANPDNDLVMAYKALNLDEELDTYEKVLLNFMLCRNMYHNENSFEWSDYCKLFFETDLCSQIHETIDDGELILQKKGLIEFDGSDGFEHKDYIRLTKTALNQFLGEFEFAEKNRSRALNQAIRIISHDEITPKQLFFNETERKELDRLTNMLQKDSFDQIIRRLEEKGMRKGVACLFHGAPGTGKTESCRALAAATGRDIYFIDMAQIKSKWVGESEENLSNVFKAYRKAVNENELAPIMVWNEADAIFGKRRNVTSAVDKMENAMQNIILQELEDLEGILIATTNFSIKDGFDPAMERRFLIKVNFDKPQVEARTKIWKSMFTDISEADAHTLATEFEFAGGLIENISRKATVDYILTGQQPSLNYLRELCVAERTGSNSSTHIGF